MEYRENWLEKESTHYIFHYKQKSYAELFIDSVIEEQEKCFRDITDLLKIFPWHLSLQWQVLFCVLGRVQSLYYNHRNITMK